MLRDPSPTLVLERLVHTQYMQKALDACKPLKSFEHESELLRNPGTSQRLLAPGHGTTT